MSAIEIHALHEVQRLLLALFAAPAQLICVQGQSHHSEKEDEKRILKQMGYIFPEFLLTQSKNTFATQFNSNKLHMIKHAFRLIVQTYYLL